MRRSGPAQPWTARLCAICAGVILPLAVGRALLGHWRWALFDLTLAVVTVYHAWRWWPRRLEDDSQRATESGREPGAGRGAAAPVDGAHHASSTTTCGGAEAPGHAGGGTAAPGPSAEPPRVTFHVGDKTP